MKKLNKLFLALAGISAVSAGLAVGTMTGTNPEADPLLATTTDHVRVYAYPLDGLGSDWLHLYIHYWGGTSSSTWAACPEMKKVVSDYYKGLWYYDVPYDTTEVLFKTGTGDVGNYQQTADLPISTYSPFEYVFYIKTDSFTDSGENKIKYWWDKAEAAGMNDGQLGAILSTIHVCDADSGYGYNSWPQLNKLFVTPSTVNRAHTFTNWNDANTNTGDTLDRIQTEYTSHLSPAQVSGLNKADDSSSTLILGSIAAAAILAAGGYFFVRKRKVD